MENFGNVIKGIVGGLILILLCGGLLAWNEYNNVRNIKAVAEARQVLVQADSEPVNPDNEGKLVAISGKLNVLDDRVSDSLFDVSEHTGKLARTVEMYQWKESGSESSKGKKTYSYQQVWSASHIDSSQFKIAGHENPPSPPFASQTFLAHAAQLGAFTLSGAQMSMLPLNGTVSDFGGSKAAAMGYTVLGEYLYSSPSAATPQIGDIRVSYKYNNSAEISLLARQTGNTFSDYRTRNGVRLNKIVDGIQPGDEIVNIIQDQNNLLKWILRAVGVLFMFFGFLLIFKPLTMAGAYIPILGSLVNMAASLISLVLALSISLVIIAVTWIAVRPLVGVGLLVVAVLLWIFLARHKRAAALRGA